MDCSRVHAPCLKQLVRNSYFIILGFYDSYEIIDETAESSSTIPKGKASGKRKITKVYRDHTTLVNVAPVWPPEKLRILAVHPVVKEYIDNRLRHPVDSSNQKIVPVYDMQWNTKVRKVLKISSIDFSNNSDFSAVDIHIYIYQ